ncbi:DoxX family membrane protein [Candidatus Woesearchaeota archaeon]|nr:DoxX family membrane protein [Candidatus Woesearchaeota archaeon]
MNKKIKIHPNFLLRLGLGFVFIWFGIDKLLNPENWIGYITPFLSSIIFFNLNGFIYLLGFIELLLGILLLTKWKLKFISLLISIYLFIVIISQGFNEITVRDIGLFTMALSLFMQEEKWQS